MQLGRAGWFFFLLLSFPPGRNEEGASRSILPFRGRHRGTLYKRRLLFVPSFPRRSRWLATPGG